MSLNPPLTTPASYSLRKVTKADLNAITQIHINGFADEPMDNYCYPHRFQYMHEHFEWIRKEYNFYLDNPQRYAVHVVETDSGETKAVAVWMVDIFAKTGPFCK